jgi:hypothetical protein
MGDLRAVDKQGRLVTRKLPPELEEVLESARRRFIAKFGREPGPTDPILFDEDADEPRPMDPDKLEREMIENMEKAGTPGHLIYAFKRTGLIVTQETYERLSPDDQFEWNEAIEEFKKHEAQGVERPWRLENLD